MQHLTSKQRTLFARQLLLPEMTEENQLLLLGNTFFKSQNKNGIMQEVLVSYLSRSGVQIETESEMGSTNCLPSSQTVKEIKEQQPNFHPKALQHLLGSFLATEYLKNVLGFEADFSLRQFKSSHE